MHALTIAVLSALGMLDAGYLLYTRIAGVSINCGPVFHGCDTVAASSYSTLLGVPLSAWGFLFYASIFVLAVCMYTRVHTKVGLSAFSAYMPHVLLVTATLGFLSSLYFTYLQAFVIHAWCMYCVISACISTAIFFLTLSSGAKK